MPKKKRKIINITRRENLTVLAFVVTTKIKLVSSKEVS